jgi:hypothetical protein
MPQNLDFRLAARDRDVGVLVELCSVLGFHEGGHYEVLPA